MNILCWLGIHKHNKWGEPYISHLQVYQTRTCARCGILKQRYLGWASSYLNIKSKVIKKDNVVNLAIVKGKSDE